MNQNNLITFTNVVWVKIESTKMIILHYSNLYVTLLNDFNDIFMLDIILMYSIVGRITYNYELRKIKKNIFKYSNKIRDNIINMHERIYLTSRCLI